MLTTPFSWSFNHWFNHWFYHGFATIRTRTKSGYFGRATRGGGRCSQGAFLASSNFQPLAQQVLKVSIFFFHLLSPNFGFQLLTKQKIRKMLKDPFFVQRWLRLGFSRTLDGIHGSADTVLPAIQEQTG